jgi:hypothetical protein
VIGELVIGEFSRNGRVRYAIPRDVQIRWRKRPVGFAVLLLTMIVAVTSIIENGAI